MAQRLSRRLEALLICSVSFFFGMAFAYFAVSRYYNELRLHVPVVWKERGTLLASVKITRTQLPTIFAITPTYTRSTQRVDLTSICHTLMHIPEITWIVIEDAVNKTQAVTNLLAKCKSVTSVHLNIKSPPTTLKGMRVPRGVSQRNAGLSWIRRSCSQNVTEKCKGVVYLMDDDNKYDLRLFEEIRKTKRVSVFPVAFAGGLKFEGPVCSEDKTAVSWHVSWAPERSMPIDMAGFAINVDLILKNKNAVLGMDEHGKVNRRLEDTFLKQFTTRETAECLGGREIMVWHVKTQVDIHNEKKNPSDNRYLI